MLARLRSRREADHPLMEDERRENENANDPLKIRFGDLGIEALPPRPDPKQDPW
jgi:hypothetical protein